MKGNEDTELNLLLAYADEHAPVLAEGLPHDAAGDQKVERGDADGTSFYDLGAAGNDLAAQGWGVIAPEGKRGDELLARIGPLIDARAEQLNTPPRIYRVPSRMTIEQALKWRQDVYNNDEPDLIPRYQLFLGDLHEVPLELQQVQGPEGFVGRLAFSDLEGYDAYIEKVLQWERTPSARERGDATFFSVHDGTSATRIGHRALIEPVVAKARSMKDEGRFHAGEIRELGDPYSPSPDELMRAAADIEAGVLFTMSHGEGAPRQGWTSARAQLNGQGAMCFGHGGNLPGRDIAGKAFASGGIWFMFACFGAGTPTRSRFHHWLSQLASVGQFRGRPEAVLASLPKGDQRPFIAALPQAALASPHGPIAFVGHLDLAWTYSFMEIDQGKSKGRPDKYYNILKSMFRGDRVGVALQELERFYNDKNQELTDLYDLAEEAAQHGTPDALNRAKIGHLWMVRQDLAGYILLGDPAVQLPLTRRAKQPRDHAPTEVRSSAKSEPKPAPAPAHTHDETAASSPPPPPAEVTAPAAEREPSPAPPPAPSPVPVAAPAEVRAPPAPVAVAKPVEEPPPATSFSAEADDPAPPRPEGREGEVGGEIDIDGPNGIKLRWLIRWRLG